MQHVTEIRTIPDLNGDFPLKITADHGAILIKSIGTYLDQSGLEKLRDALNAAEQVAAMQRADLEES